MKTILASLLVLGLSTSAFAQAPSSSPYPCKEIFEAKITRQKKYAGVKSILYVAAGAASAIGTGILVAGPGAVSAAIVFTFFPGLIPGIFVGGGLIGATENRVDGIADAYDAQELMNTTYADLMAKFVQVRDDELTARLKKFDIDVTYPDYAAKILAKATEMRKAAGLPYIPDAQMIAYYRTEMEKAVRAKPIKITNAVTESLEWAQKKDSSLVSIKYDDWTKTLVQNQALFCEGGKARTLKRTIRRILREHP